jgi:MFS family permease
MNSSSATQATGWRWAGRALRSRNYRLFFLGQGISLIGTWMQRIAMSWLVYDLTRSPLLLGSLDFSGQMTACILSPFAGYVADHNPRRRLILITQVLSMVQAGILAALVLTHHVQVWHLFALAMCLGAINAFDMPARQTFVVEMIEDKADLSNAIALNSTMFNGARLVGPALAGVIIAVTGEGICFLLNAVSYLAVIWALLAMRVKPFKPVAVRPAILAGLKDGFSYAWNSQPIRQLLLLIGIGNLAGMPYMALMPIFARKVLHGGPQTMGFLVSSVGVGAIIGAMYLASRRRIPGLGRVAAVAAGIYALGLFGFSESHYLPLSMTALFLIGAGMTAQMATTNTILQTIVEDDKRGRVMAIYMMSFIGMAPIGSLLGGAAATHIGAPLTVYIGGWIVLLGALLFASRLKSFGRAVRPVYEKLGFYDE